MRFHCIASFTPISYDLIICCKILYPFKQAANQLIFNCVRVYALLSVNLCANIHMLRLSATSINADWKKLLHTYIKSGSVRFAYFQNLWHSSKCKCFNQSAFLYSVAFYIRARSNSSRMQAKAFSSISIHFFPVHYYFACVLNFELKSKFIAFIR